MPIYEYECPKCKALYGILQKFNDPAPLCMCEDGDPVIMQRVLSKSTFSLKGSGWARDGYSSKKG